MKTQPLTVRLERAGLLTYTAPPAPNAKPFRTFVENVATLHPLNVERRMRTVKFEPMALDELSRAMVRLGKTCGDWITATAPPNTQEESNEPKSRVYDTAKDL
jgi:hypothetical protein